VIGRMDNVETSVARRGCELFHELGNFDRPALQGMRHVTGRTAYLINALLRGLKNKMPSVGSAARVSVATLYSSRSLYSLPSQGE